MPKMRNGLLFLALPHGKPGVILGAGEICWVAKPCFDFVKAKARFDAK
jgi:hypothetical protein